MKKIAVFLLALSAYYSAGAQKYFTKNGKVSFTSKTPVETINADNNQVLAIIDPSGRQVAFSLLVKGFLFEKQLMQDHFNEEVLESDKFPKANYVGQISDKTDITKPGNYHVHITGTLTIHGISKPVSAEADIQLAPGSLKATSSFRVVFTDFNIKMPSVLQNNISKSILVTVMVDCSPMSK